MVKENDIITDGTTKWKVRRLGGSSDGNPVGTIIMYAANTMPDGYLLCDGSAISRTDYAELFRVIGTTWGAGDGSTTFNLPNAVGRFPEGSATAGGYMEAGLPDIQGFIGDLMGGYGDYRGAFRKSAMLSNKLNSQTYGVNSIDFLASLYNEIYGKSNTVQPSAIIYRQLIKYI